MSDASGFDWLTFLKGLGSVGPVLAGAAYVVRQLYTEKRADRAGYDLELKNLRAGYDLELKNVRAAYDLELKNLQALYNQKNETFTQKLDEREKAQAALIAELLARLKAPGAR